MWTGDDSPKAVIWLLAVLSNGIEDARMIGAEIDKTMGDSSLQSRIVNISARVSRLLLFT